MKNVCTVFLFTLVLIIPFKNILSQEDDTCPPGMISYWKLDEFGDVNMFADSYGENFAFTADTSRPEQIEGIINRARRFDTESEIVIPQDNIYEWGLNESFSIELWVKIPDKGIGTKVFIGRYEDNSNMSWFLAQKDGNTIFSLTDSSGVGAYMVGSKIITDDQWHHIVAVKNDSVKVVQLFVDGENDAIQSTFFVGNFKGNSSISVGFYNNSFHLVGSLDEIAIYNRTLSLDEASQHYTNGLAGINYCEESTTDVNENKNIPSAYSLKQNFPNPFNPSTIIEFNIPRTVNVNLSIYNVLGKKMETLVNGFVEAGPHFIEFNGSGFTSGVYLYKLETPYFIQTKKMLLVK